MKTWDITAKEVESDISALISASSAVCTPRYSRFGDSSDDEYGCSAPVYRSVMRSYASEVEMHATVSLRPRSYWPNW